MRTLERRRRRTDLITQALTYQLLACCEDGGVHAMVVADSDGLSLASSGDRRACDELAARMAQVGARTDGFAGTLLSLGSHGSVDFQGIAKSQLTAGNFHIG